MAKQDDQIVLSGIVRECLPGAMFRVDVPGGNTVLGHISGKMRKNKIQVLTGDKVQIEFSVYDLTRGRILYREK